MIYVIVAILVFAQILDWLNFSSPAQVVTIFSTAFLWWFGIIADDPNREHRGFGGALLSIIYLVVLVVTHLIAGHLATIPCAIAFLVVCFLNVCLMYSRMCE